MAEWDRMGLEAQEGGVRYHLAGLYFRVALVLGVPGLEASSGPGKLDLQLSIMIMCQEKCQAMKTGILHLATNKNCKLKKKNAI